MIKREIKRKVFAALINRDDFLGIYNDYDGILTFLGKIWPLRDMPSEDSRFDNAYEDARQHLVNNNDWELEPTFTDRFKLIDGKEEYFESFLETVVSPDVRGNTDSILVYVSIINGIIISSPHKLVHVDYFEELPVYRLMDRNSHSDLPIQISANKMPFFKSKEKIDQYPCFLLIYDNWDDFGYKTTFSLEYHTENNRWNKIGAVSIMKRDTNKTWDAMPIKFTSLDNSYCSLGISIEYYKTFQSLLSNYQSALFALRDVALFPKIAEEFENDLIFKTSFLRMNDAEMLMRTARFTLNGINLGEAFKFNFNFRPPYAQNDINLNFDFQYEGGMEHRIYGLIGKNGTGKTRILSSLVNALSQDQPKTITPKRPLYGKVFSVSYSFFDRFEIPEANASFNYVYCGLKKRGGGWMSEEELKARFYDSARIIKEKEELSNWYLILKTFIPKDIVDEMFQGRGSSFEFVASRFGRVYEKVSSGQNILMFIITEIIAQIRYNSLIVYDEPETHLHPNAISELMNTIFALTDQFNSFCIIATHSPIVIQELQSRNIYVLERDDQMASVRKLDKEAFGENLTVITEDIFGNRDVAKHHIEFLRRLVREDKSFDEIVSLLETDEIPLSLNVRLYIKSLIAEENEKS